MKKLKNLPRFKMLQSALLFCSLSFSALSSANTPATVNIDWEFDTSAEVRSAPSVSPSGQIYVGSKEGSLFSLNNDGSEAWRFHIGSTVQSEPVWFDNTIYFGGNNNTFYAIDEQGNQLWSLPTNGSNIAKAVIWNDRVIFGSLDGAIYNVNRYTGESMWIFETHGSIKTAPLVDTDGSVYAVSDNGKLYALTSEGKVRWDYLLPSRPMTTPVLDSAKTIFLATFDGTFYGFDQGGIFEWSHKAASKLAYQELAIIDDTLYAVGYDKHLTAVQTWGSTLWRKNFSAFITSSARVSEGVGAEKYLLITDYAGKVTRVDKSGNTTWQTTLPTRIAATAALDNTSGDIIVGGLNGKIYSIQEN